MAGIQSAEIRRLGYRPALDGVRAIAIVAVMGLHTISSMVPGGFLGVDVFFVLSAFLITSLILQEVNDTEGRFSFSAFYQRRARRLLPALGLWLVFLAVPTAVLQGEADRIVPSVLATLLYIGNLAVAQIVDLPVAASVEHIWSLAIEEQFYLLWPVVLVAVVMPRAQGARRALLLSFAALAPVVHVATVAVYSADAYFLPTGHLTPIALGCLAGYLFTFGVPAWMRPALGREVLAVGCLGVLCVLFVSEGRFPLAAETSAVGLAAAVLLLHFVLSPASRVGTLLSARAVVWIGRRSYGLYLYHRTITILIPLLVPGITLRVAGPLGVAVSLLLAAGSYRFVERPIVQASRRTPARSEAS